MSLAATERAKSSIVNEPVRFVVDPWILVETETEVILAPQPMPWHEVGMFCGLFVLFCGLLALPVVVGEEPDRQWEVVIGTALLAVVTCTFTVIFVYSSYRANQKEGPQLFIDRVGGMVHLPKHNLSVPFDRVEHFEVRSSMPDEEGKFPTETIHSELVLLVRVDGQLIRYPILDSPVPQGYNRLAREIAKLNILPVKRVQATPDCTLIDEKWLTPPPEATNEPTGDPL